MADLTNLINAAAGASTLAELLEVFDTFLYQPPANVNFGVDKADRASITTLRKAANAKAVDIIKRISDDPNSVTEEDKDALRKYTGLGGLGGSTNEYYTPQWVAGGAWDALAAYGFKNGNVLEPSGGVGVFSSLKPKGTLMTSVELDKTSSAINQILHPEDEVINSSFERFVQKSAFTDIEASYDAVIGNPPYGSRDASMIDDVGYRDIKLADQYFVTRAIDMCRHGGLICLVLPSRIVEGKKLKKWRREIALKAEFLGAQRLPTGTFGNNGSDSVVTDVVIWRKHPKSLYGKIQRLDADTLIQANLLWDTWLDGKWYQKDGQKFIHGTEKTVGKGQWARKVVERGSRTDDQIKAAMAHKFDSRIDWDLLEVKEPNAKVYSEGDHRVINGTMMRFDGDQWVSAIQKDATGGLSADVYGASSEEALATMTANPGLCLQADFEHLKNAYRDLAGDCDPDFNEAMAAIKKLPEGKQERAFRGMMLGHMVNSVSDLAAVPDDSEEHRQALNERREQVASMVFAEFDKHGDPHKLKGLSTLSGKAMAKWQAFANAIDGKGELSELLGGNLKREETASFDLRDPRQVLAAFYQSTQQTAIDVGQFRVVCTEKKDHLSDEEYLSYLAQMEDIAINSDGTISQMHNATSGDIVAKLESLRAGMANIENPIIAANLRRQIDVIEQRRTWTETTDIKFKLTDNWVPRSVILEFLQSRGYEHFVYAKTETDSEGNETLNQNYTGEDGFFTGYRTRDGVTRNNPDEKFERQLESYLNKVAVRGGSGNEGRAAVREQVRQLDDDFAMWIATSDHADTLTTEYNNRFNGFIAPSYDDSNLGLQGTSGAIQMMGYQNATVRRFSDEGCGIIGFGTGLGKTFTGLALATYNLQTGRSKRIAFVVPKSVLENWYHESDLFFGKDNLANKMFIGIEPVRDKDGNIVREPVLDEEGNQVIGNDGQPQTKAKLNVDTSTKKIAPDLHRLAQSNVSIVVMTKDVFASIPLKDSTITENVETMVSQGLVAGSNKLVAVAETHREKEKNNRFEAKYADDGSTKKHALPYFEDLLIDSIITDEGHNYRNSYKTGSFGNRLAFMPNSATADIALDMQMKNNYVKRVNRDRGCYSLTATPTVNSPIDAFNMLSQVVPSKVWARLGIVDSDDFIRMFGRTGETAVHKLSGKVETKEALLGFQNLDALRSLFHRYTEIKTIKDVSGTVHIPDLVTHTNYVDMSPEQAEIYENLRLRADALSNPDSDEAKAIAEEYPDDTVFGLIRDMDKACTDLDLYHGVVTFVFPKSNASKVQSLADDLPTTITVNQSVIDEKTGTRKNKKVKRDASVSVTTDAQGCKLVVTAELDPEVIKRLAKFGLKKFSHPAPPKIAKFLEKAKAVYLDGGKQLVFTEEKTQHVKLARMIADYTGCKLSEIGIINADTVAGKKGSGVDEGTEEAGLDNLSAAYNEGRYRFMILNKKGEVGVNLHRGTTDIHHLTLPFTPSSLTQRNGRGARVGSKAKKVNVHYYAGKGSFDKFRISTIERKARWIDDLFTGDAKSVDNANAEDPNEHMIMLAPDPEEARRRVARNEAIRKEKMEAEYRRVAAVNVNNYLKAVTDSQIDQDELQAKIDALQAEHDEHLEKVEERRAANLDKWGRDRLKDAEDDYFKSRKELMELKSQMGRYHNAQAAIKRFKPQVEKAIKDGYLAVDSDIFTHPELYFASKGKVARIGGTYEAKMNVNLWTNDTYMATVNIREFDRRKGTVSGIMLQSHDQYAGRQGMPINIPLDNLVRQSTSIDQKEAELMGLSLAGMEVAKVTQLMDRTTFYRFAKEGWIRFKDTSDPLIERDGKFDLTSQAKENADYLVYPDLADKGLQERFAKYCAQYSMDNGNLPYLRSWPELILGKNWKDVVNQYGNTATDQEITQWVQDKIKQAESRWDDLYQNALQSGHVDGWWRRVRDLVFNVDMPNITNRNDEDRIATQIANDYRTVMKKRSEDFIQRAKDSGFATYIQLISDSAGRDDRIKNLAGFASKYRAEHHFIKNVVEMYDSNYVLMMADLTAAGMTPQLPDGEELYGSNAKWRIEGKLGNLFNDKQSKIIDVADKLLKKPEVAPLNDTQQAIVDNVDKIAPGDISEQLKQMGIIAKTNTSLVTRKFRRKSTTYEPYSVLGLQDTKGYDGVLRKKKDNLKEQFDAIYCVDGNDEFEGSWWLVPADTDLTKIVSALN